MLCYVIIRVRAYLVRPITDLTATDHITCSIMLRTKWMDNYIADSASAGTSHCLIKNQPHVVFSALHERCTQLLGLVHHSDYPQNSPAASCWGLRSTKLARPYRDRCYTWSNQKQRERWTSPSLPFCIISRFQRSSPTEAHGMEAIMKATMELEVCPFRLFVLLLGAQFC